MSDTMEMNEDKTDEENINEDKADGEIVDNEEVSSEEIGKLGDASNPEQIGKPKELRLEMSEAINGRPAIDTVSAGTEPNAPEGKGLDYKLFGIIVGVIFVSLILILALPHFYTQKQKTLQDRYNDVLAGNENDEQYLYNAYAFVRTGAESIGYMWYTQVVDQYTGQKYDVPMHYDPKSLETFGFEGDTEAFTNMIYGQNNSLPIYDSYDINMSQFPYLAYFSFDPNAKGLDYINLAHHELRTSLLQAFHVRLLPACLNATDSACDTVAVLTCENTTLPIIVFNEVLPDYNLNNMSDPSVVQDPTGGILVEGNCITISSYGKGMVKGVDRLLYDLYGIMD